MNKSIIQSGERFDWLLLLLITLSSIASGIYRDGFSALFPFLQEEFALTRAQLGLHSTAVFFANMFIGLYSGRLIDLKGTKWGLFFGTIVLGVSIILHSFAPNYATILVLAAITGSVISINHPAANKGISEWFPEKWKTTAIGINSSGVPVGGVMAATMLPLLGVLIGWRTSILIPGLFALLCAFLIYTFYQDKNNEADDKNDHHQQSDLNSNKTSFIQSIYLLTKNPNFLITSILGFFLGAASGTVAAHFAIFLYLDYGLTEKIAGVGLAFIQVGSFFGRPGWGLICDKVLYSNKKIAFLFVGILFTLLSLAFGLLFRIWALPLPVIFILAFLVGFSGRGWHGLYFASVTETVKSENIGTAMGFSLFFVRGGIMIFPPIFGYIADFRGLYDLSWLIMGTLVLLASLTHYYYSKYRQNHKIAG